MQTLIAYIYAKPPNTSFKIIHSIKMMQLRITYIFKNYERMVAAAVDWNSLTLYTSSPTIVEQCINPLGIVRNSSPLRCDKDRRQQELSQALG